MTATPVVTALEAYRVAMAELPASAVLAHDNGGAVVVVDGAGSWWREAQARVAEGAAAVVVARPALAPVPELAALLAHTGSAPIILERPLLRPDVQRALIDALSAERGTAAALVVECHAPADTLPLALRDAVGWARVLAGGGFQRRASSVAGGRALALLEAAGGAVVSLVAAAQPGAPALGRLRITALGETLIEIDDDEGDPVVAMTDAGGRRELPRRFERPERVALGRAVDAVRAKRSVDDLAGLVHDAAVAEQVLGRSFS